MHGGRVPASPALRKQDCWADQVHTPGPEPQMLPLSGDAGGLDGASLTSLLGVSIWKSMTSLLSGCELRGRAHFGHAHSPPPTSPTPWHQPKVLRTSI